MTIAYCRGISQCPFYTHFLSSRLMTRRWIRPSLVVPSNAANGTPRKAPPIKMPREHMNNCITEQLLGGDGFSWICDHTIKSLTFSRKCNSFLVRLKHWPNWIDQSKWWDAVKILCSVIIWEVDLPWSPARYPSSTCIREPCAHFLSTTCTVKLNWI